MRFILPLVSAAFILALVGCGGSGGSTRRVIVGDTIRTASGLKYIELERGTGPVAVKGMKVRVDYAGYFLNDTLFDTSIDSIARAHGYTRSVPFAPYQLKLGVGEVIKGWDEALATNMRVGGSRRIIVPPELAYGVRPRAGIPPNSTLVFDIHLIDAQMDTVRLMSGLRYIEYRRGTGMKIEPGMQIAVNYAGYLTDGTLFDTSLDSVARMRGFDRGGVPFEPLGFQVGKGKVIVGWDEGLTHDMYVGGKRRLIIPPALGYGSYQHGAIPANSTLIFDVEVVSADAGDR